jgi:hypothetical protein
LAGAGFHRNRRAMRSKNDFKRGNYAANFFLRPGYLNIFEVGGVIRPKKSLLWLPLDSVPTGEKGRKLTPKQFIQRVGPLHSVGRIGGGKPLLVGAGNVKRATSARTTFRKNAPVRAGRSRGLVNVPLYVGIPSATIRKKLNLKAVVRRVGATVGALYAKHIKEQRRGI